MAQTSHWTRSVACSVKGFCASVYKGLGAETSICELWTRIEDKKSVDVPYLKLYLCKRIFIFVLEDVLALSAVTRKTRKQLHLLYILKPFISKHGLYLA